MESCTLNSKTQGSDKEHTSTLLPSPKGMLLSSDFCTVLLFWIWVDWLSLCSSCYWKSVLGGKPIFQWPFICLTRFVFFFVLFVCFNVRCLVTMCFGTQDMPKHVAERVLSEWNTICSGASRTCVEMRSSVCVQVVCVCVWGGGVGVFSECIQLRLNVRANTANCWFFFLLGCTLTGPVHLQPPQLLLLPLLA